MAHRRLSLGLYRAIWRWARSGNGVPFTLRFEDVRSVAPGCLQPIGEAICAPSVPLHEADAVLELAHRAFRDNRHLEVLAERSACCPALRARSFGMLTVPTPRPCRRERSCQRPWTAGWRCELVLAQFPASCYSWPTALTRGACRCAGGATAAPRLCADAGAPAESCERARGARGDCLPNRHLLRAPRAQARQARSAPTAYSIISEQTVFDRLFGAEARLRDCATARVSCERALQAAALLA
jgi:hypothetical protein